MFEFIKNLFAREPEYNVPKACVCKKELVLLPEPVKAEPVAEIKEVKPARAPAKPRAVKAPAKPKVLAKEVVETVEEVKAEAEVPKKRGRKPAVKK